MSDNKTIKINIITFNNQYGLTNDMKMLAKLLEKTFQKRVEIKLVDFFHYKAPQADINIFLETVSKILFKYADVNILIPNQEWYYKTWIPYLTEVDYILTKSHYAEEIFKNLIPTKKENIKYIGWKSLDRELQNVRNDYKEFLHLCGRSKLRQTQLIIDSWEKDFPKLTIVYNPKYLQFKHRADLDNITYITERLTDEELLKLMNKCGVHLCCSETEGYGHYIYEAKSTGAVVITTDAQPMKSSVNESSGFLVKTAKKKPLKKHLGQQYIIDENDFKEVIKKVQNTPIATLKKMGNNARDDYVKESKYFDSELKNSMVEIFRHIKSDDDKKKQSELMKELANMPDEDFPSVSIITPTYNRRHFFNLAVNNFNNFRYPKDKLEWIIVDDGTDKLKDVFEKESTLKNDPRIKYFELDEKKPIGFKRNYCIEKASNQYIICMDDDDFYPVNSVKIRILEMLKSKKDCVTCSAIGCFDVNKYVSMVNVPPHRLPFSERISEASLGFKKSFWEVQKFNDESKHSEAKEFLDGRENQTVEISWEGVLVSLLHHRNTSDKILIDQAPNGCHYGWNDDLFLFITSLDKDLTDEENEIKKKNKKVRTQDPDDDGHLPN
jgi:hypothetical protein